MVLWAVDWKAMQADLPFGLNLAFGVMLDWRLLPILQSLHSLLHENVIHLEREDDGSNLILSNHFHRPKAELEILQEAEDLWLEQEEQDS